MFQVGGIKNVQDAFRTIDQSLARIENGARVSYENQTRSAKLSASAQEKEAAKISSHGLKEAAKLSAARIKEDARAHAAITREGERAAKLGEKLQAKGAKEVERAEREKLRAVERSSKAIEREFSKVERWGAQEKRKELREFENVEKSKTRAAESASKARQRFGATVYGKSAAGVSKAVGTAGALAGSVLAVGGGFGVVDALSKESKNRSTAIDISNSGQRDGQAITDPKEILEAAKATTIKYGFEDTGAALEGLQAFVGKSGDLKLALETMDKLAELSQATGSNLQKVSQAAGVLAATDKSLDGGGIVELMRVVAGHGKDGTVELRDLAQYMTRLASSAGQYENSVQRKSGESQADYDSRGRRKNVGVLSAMAQMSLSGGATDAAEMTEAAKAFGHDVSSRRTRARLNDLGVETIKNGKIRSPEEIIVETLRKSKGDVGIINSTFNEQSAKAINGAATTYRNAEGVKAGSGEAAVRAEFDNYARLALSAEETKRASDAKVADGEAQLNAALNQLRDTVSKDLYPEFIKLIPVLRGFISEVAPRIGGFVQKVSELAAWFAENPFKSIFFGLGALVSGVVAKEMAVAGIGALIKSILSGGASGAGAGLSGIAGAVGATGIGSLGVGAAGLAGAAAIGYMGFNSIDSAAAGFGKGSQTAGEITVDARRGGAAGKQRAIDALGQARKNDNALDLVRSVTSLGFSTAKSLVTGEQNQSFEGIRKYSEARGIMSKEKEISDAIVDKPAITQALTAAITEGIKAGVANAASPDSPSRSVPMQSRQ
jgi:hypothetical protein